MVKEIIDVELPLSSKVVTVVSGEAKSHKPQMPNEIQDNLFRKYRYEIMNI